LEGDTEGGQMNIEVAFDLEIEARVSIKQQAIKINHLNLFVL
jgi:hypothetical protein